MRAAELAKVYQSNIQVRCAQTFLQPLEYFVSEEEVIPELGDGLTLQGVESGRERLKSHLSCASRPVRFVVAVIILF